MDDIIIIGICDDDIEARQQIENLVMDYEQKNLLVMEIHQFSCAKDLLEYPKRLDLLYLDIELGEDSGIDVVPIIRKKHPDIEIIFVTSHWKYFIHSHRLNVFQFLTKPFDQPVFYEELERFCQKYRLQRDLYEVNFQNTMVQFPIGEILYIEAALRHLYIFHASTGKHEKFGQIAHEENLLKPYGFIRCHRSFLVNAAHIVQMKNLKFFLHNPISREEILIPISKQRIIQVRNEYQDWLLERRE